MTRVTNLRTGAVMGFAQSNGSLTISGITDWDTYDIVFRVGPPAGPPSTFPAW